MPHHGVMRKCGPTRKRYSERVTLARMPCAEGRLISKPLLVYFSTSEISQKSYTKQKDTNIKNQKIRIGTTHGHDSTRLESRLMGTKKIYTTIHAGVRLAPRLEELQLLPRNRKERVDKLDDICCEFAMSIPLPLPGPVLYKYW